MRLAVCVVGVLLPWATGFAPSWSGGLARRSGSVPGDRVRLRWIATTPQQRARAAGAVQATRDDDDDGPNNKRLVSPIAGASVSPDGFVVFLSYKAAGRYFEEDRYIPVVISSQDTDVVRSPEALTLLQLMQGIDMGTPLLPPDALQRAYDEPGSALRPRDPKTGQRVYEPESVALTEVRIYPPRPGANFGGDSEELAPGRALDLTSEQMALRDSAIRARAPDLVKALRTLNVIIDSDRAIDLLRAYSSEKGDLDRAAFSDALAAARVPVSRSPKSPWARSPPAFSLVAVTSESVGKEADVSAFMGLSLHLRHRVPIVVKGGRRAPGDTKDVEANAEPWDRYSFDAADVGTLYPSWRSIDQITEEGTEMVKRTAQLFQEAKNAKIIRDLQMFGFLKNSPPDLDEEWMNPLPAPADVESRPLLGDSSKTVSDELAASETAAAAADADQRADAVTAGATAAAEAAIRKLQRDFEAASAAGAAALPKAIDAQDAMKSTVNSYGDKLKALAAMSSSRLGVSFFVGPSDLSKFREESVKKLKKAIAQSLEQPKD